ncbi:hypothetical protein WJR50_16510 [Catalinimonas sp. 4WD22]|uniref:hypothetical protein n=1 Tax=Catalinimonas locisalis TaxID=3133978 RepID=UPI003100FA98
MTTYQSKFFGLFMVFILLSGFSLAQESEEGVFFTESGEALTAAEKEFILPLQFDLFSDDTPLEITLESDFKNFNKKKYKPKNQPAMLHVNLNDSVVVRREIRIKPRGEFRRSYCSFPPIKLNLKKVEFEVEHLQQLEKMKMVVDCRQSDLYQNYLLREYLTYKLFSLFTELSFQVRLIHVRYLDTGRERHNDRTAYAFLIEEIEDVAQRNNALEIKQDKLGQTSTNPQQMLLVAMFHYMIGNTDWSVPGRHNVKLIKKKDIQDIYPYTIPYDFDYSGLVNASYAVPYEKLGLNGVRERMFLGFCHEPSDFEKAIQLFLEKEEAVLQLVENFDYLEERDKRDIIDFLNEFYEQIKRDNAVKYFTNNCRSF